MKIENLIILKTKKTPLVQIRISAGGIFYKASILKTQLPIFMYNLDNNLSNIIQEMVSI